MTSVGGISSDRQMPPLTSDIPWSHSQLESFINKLEEVACTHSNLTHADRKALHSLSTIKLADKGSKIEVQDTSEYLETGYDHLKDTSIYESLNGDLRALMIFMDKLKEHVYIDETTHSFLKQEESPIVSRVNSLTERLPSSTCCNQNPLKHQGTVNLIRQLNTSLYFIFCIVDVSSLYLSIPQAEGTEACLSELMSEDRMQLPQNILKQKFDNVLKYDVFSFYNTCYKQIQGTAMGSPMAPAYAGNFMSKSEEEFLSKQPPKALLCKRYIDDVIILWTRGEKELNDFLQSLNQAHPTISEIDHNKITYLDVDLQKIKLMESFKIGCSIHFKECALRHSFHPASTKKGIVKGELTRISRTTSVPTVTDSTLDFIVGMFPTLPLFLHKSVIRVLYHPHVSYIW